MKNLFSILSIFVCLFCQLEAKIRLLTFHYNRPDFIEYQKRCLDRFLTEKDDYELIVFNDAPTEEMASKIQAMCDKWDVQCVRYDQSWHRDAPLLSMVKEWLRVPHKPYVGFEELSLLLEKHPSVRHCNVIQYALDHYGYDHDDIVALMDGDMFIIRPTSIRKLLENYAIVGTVKNDPTANVEFFWVALTFFDVRKLPDRHSLKFNLSRIGDYIVDSGAHSYFYVQTHPSVPMLKVKRIPVGDLKKYKPSQLAKILNYSPAEIHLIKNMNHDAEFHMNGHFLHYLRSSFMSHENVYAPETKEYHVQKSAPIATFFEKILIN